MKSLAQSSKRLEVHFNEVDHSLQLNRWFLKPLGAWPCSSTASFQERIISVVLVLTCSGFLAYTIVPTILYMFLEESDFKKRLKIVGPLGHWLSGSLNYSFLLMHAKEIQFCVDHMRTDWNLIWRKKDRNVMESYAQLGRYVAGFCGIFMHFGVFSYITILAFNTQHVSVGNETLTLHRLPFPMYSKIVDAYKRPTNEIVIATQFASCFIANSVTAGACSLAAVFTIHAYGQLDLLMEWLEEFVQEESKREENRNRSCGNVSILIQHHLRTLSFIAYIEEIMHQICLVELLGCTAQICMLGYYTVMEWEDRNVQTQLTYCIIFISMSFNILTFCYIADALKEQCKKVGDTAYMTTWYELPHKTALDFILIISRSSTVIQITAGKLIQLSVSTFGQVIKTAVAYINILRAM